MNSSLLENRAEVEVGVGARDIAGVGIRKMAKVGMEVPVPSIRASGALPTSSSLPIKGGLQQKLQQMHAPAMLIGWIKKIKTNPLNKLVNQLGLELLKL